MISEFGTSWDQDKETRVQIGTFHSLPLEEGEKGGKRNMEMKDGAKRLKARTSRWVEREIRSAMKDMFQNQKEF